MMRITREIKVRNKLGLHARPAAMLVQLTNRFKSEIAVSKDDMKVNAKSIMGVMMLAAECGSELVFEATGPESDKALAELCKLVADGFGEK